VKVIKEKPKLTPQREAVFQVIQERDDHPTAGEIFEAARRRLPGISYATVYNSLRYLKEAAWFTRLILETARAATIAKPIGTIMQSVTIVGSWSTSICQTPRSSCRRPRENHVFNLSPFI